MAMPALVNPMQSIQTAMIMKWFSLIILFKGVSCGGVESVRNDSGFCVTLTRRPLIGACSFHVEDISFPYPEIAVGHTFSIHGHVRKHFAGGT
jgi:hypothetical protein